MAKFNVGEVAVYVGLPGVGWRGRAGPGSECTVASRPKTDDAGDVLYYCHFEGDPCPRSLYLGCWLVYEAALRKKPPRREIDRVVSWADVPWRPAALTAK